MSALLPRLSAGLVLAGLTAGCVLEPAESPPVQTAARPKAEPTQTEPGPTDPDAPEGFLTTSSGLKYRILRKSDGRKPTAADTVLCHYKGTLDDGTVFDSSYDRGKPIDFPLNGVIRGWTEGLQLIGEGGMIELEIPGNLGYGLRGSPPTIPPNATLHFIVELKQIL
ncbi:FKBP-type peptidyl-prolyl cis-trans isomerase [bacterium]|nr:FKBP-type peptidyl-prolyl cis-trans isomerase [bacterium]